MPRFRIGFAAVLAASSLLPACRHAPASAPATTADAPVAEDPAPAGSGRAEWPAPRSADDVVARVGGEPITRRDLERASYDKPPNEALGSLVEWALLRRGAEAKGIHLSDDEVETATSRFAASYGLNTERLRARVEAAKIPWSTYREQVRSQMLESKLVRSRARPGPKDDKDAWLVAWNHERRVVLACLRAETKIEFDDPQLRLPDEPFATRVHVDGVGIFGAVGASVDPWIAAAEAAIQVDAPLCRAVPAIEDAVMNAMLEAGYLLATVEARWPDSVPSNVTVELDVQTGPLHRVGTVGFDQSMVPAAWRLEEPALRDRLKQGLVKGEVASWSRLETARTDVNAALEAYGLGVADVARTVHGVGSEARVDLRYQLTPLRAAPEVTLDDGPTRRGGR